VGSRQQGFRKQCKYLRVVEYLLERMVQMGVAHGVHFHADMATKIMVGSEPALSRNFMRDFSDSLSEISL
jgi:hypothetical protein